MNPIPDMGTERMNAAQKKAIRDWLGVKSEEEADAMLNDPRTPADESWLLLNEGDRVRVQREGRILHGTVDCVAADGSIFWIWQDAGAGRTAIYEDHDVSVSVCQSTNVCSSPRSSSISSKATAPGWGVSMGLAR